jgi:glycosyltransferase involved in cell wall biosynthesis
MIDVAVYAPYADPSTHYRLTEPARVTGTRVVDRLPQVGDAEVVVLNRPLTAGIAEQVRLWRDEGRRVVVDLDDCFDTVSPNHHIAGMYTTEHLHAACRAASVVTCSTPALAERYGYGHGVVLRNRVPEAQTLIRRAGNREPTTWVGWYGSLASHPDDPAAAGDGVGQALNGSDAEFTYVGPQKDAPELKQTFGLARDVNALGFTSMFGLPALVAEFDIGIVPLADSKFNQAKSALKGLEMAAVGVPVIASPTDEYRRLADVGACVTAKMPDDWESWLLDFLLSSTLRAEQAERGAAWARTQTYELHADDWRTVWYSHV